MFLDKESVGRNAIYTAHEKKSLRLMNGEDKKLFEESKCVVANDYCRIRNYDIGPLINYADTIIRFSHKFHSDKMSDLLMHARLY